ncbi:MAG: peptidase C39 [Fluviicola sp.]|nr:MAG: peptidase C39 [Fluviicola sp.]
MNINHNIFISVILTIILFFVGTQFIKRFKKSKYKSIFLVFSFLFAIPGLSMVTYYMHLIESPNWYITFRAIPGIECMNSLIGLFLGMIISNKKFLALSFSIFLVIIPYAKPIVRPININSETKWIDDVCIQSTYASCGPSSLATILKAKNINTTEREIAANAFTCSSGTEIWYLLRYATKKGLNFSCNQIHEIEQVKTPCIIGTEISNIGHFITVLEKNKDEYIIGDPLIGRIKLTKKQFNQKYLLDGLMIHFH